MLELIIQPLKAFLDGVLGKDRREKKKLATKLIAARAERDRLSQARNLLDDGYERVTTERDRLKSNYKHLVATHKQLKLDYAQLQESHSQLEKKHQEAITERDRTTHLYNQLKDNHRQLQDKCRQLEQNYENWTQEQAETQKLFAIASDENQKFADEKEKLKEENVQLNCEIAVLEDELARQAYQYDSQDEAAADASKMPINSVSSEQLSRMDLADSIIALVGGHDSTRHQVIRKLQNNHGLKEHHLHEVKPDQRSSSSSIREKIQHCDFVFIIAGYMPHKLSKSVMQLRNKAAIKGEVIPLETRGATGVLREILTYIANHRLSA